MTQTYLPDVNVLLAWVDPGHLGRSVVKTWLSRNKDVKIAFCAHTENGFIRVLSGTRYPNIQLRPADACRLLADLQQSLGRRLVRWPESLSLTDHSVFDLQSLLGANQVTDAFLLGLAHKHHARVVTMDRGMPRQAIRGATASMVEVLDISKSTGT